MKKSDKLLLMKNVWSIECESPFEIRHETGAFASGVAGDVILDDVHKRKT